MTEGITLKEYERAEAELRTRKRHSNFYTHVALYVLINALLIIINVAFLTAFPWSLIPLVLWGVGLLAHYFDPLSGYQMTSRPGKQRSSTARVKFTVGV